MGLVVMILAPFSLGYRMYYTSPMSFMRDPLIWVRSMSKYRANWTSVPCFALGLSAKRWLGMGHRIEKEKPLDLRCVYLIVLGGEPVMPDIVHSFLQVFKDHGISNKSVRPAYGLAEYTVAVSVANDNARVLVLEEINKVPRMACGSKDHFFGDVRIVNPDTCEEMPEAEEGEIWVSGPGGAIGYWNQEEKSREIFYARLATAETKPFLYGGDGRYIRTGDMGAWKNGRLYISGRIKDLVIVRGKNFFPQVSISWNIGPLSMPHLFYP